MPQIKSKSNLSLRVKETPALNKFWEQAHVTPRGELGICVLHNYVWLEEIEEKKIINL